ncbi:MAG TPA: ATP-binding protein [Patescibacteria group bacterium]|nr:ATP-binding protein [Patescibacteria group bacterium]
MRLTPHDRDWFRVLAVILMAAAMVLSVGAAIYLGRSTASNIRLELSERSQTIAAALTEENIAKLSGTEADGDTTAYTRLKEQLASVKSANPDTRSIYLMGRHHGQLFFFVDSEQPNSHDYSTPGEDYNDGTPADSAIFDNAKPLVEGPVTDEYGTFISGLAPIKDPSNGAVAAVLGIDVASSTYYRSIAYAAAVPLLTGLSFTLILQVFENIRRRNAQLLTLRSELVSVASHELRNPITGIRWAADSVEKLNTNEKLRPMIHAIKNSAEGLQASTDDILELSHAMNRRSLTVAPADMSQLMQEVFGMQLLSAQRRGVSLRFDSSWPHVLMIPCDADQMKRVLHNVISNAIKYTGDNTVVTVAYKEDDKMHHLLVVDQGIGIPASEQAKVFKGFYRASNAVASRVPGTGLGLFLVKAVLEQHGGNVTFVSAEGKGTTFDLSLPKRG